MSLDELRLVFVYRDLVEAYAWFSIAADQITRTKNALKQDMTAAQIATAERQMRGKARHDARGRAFFSGPQIDEL
ncbi:MAG: hypothetical protein WBE44_11665 [Terriglobales bacterium]|jgi:hypothetical protein